jgi:hypothetical protein
MDETEYMVLRHTSNRSELKIYYTPHASARVIGRSERPKIKDMFGPLKPGMIIQI